MFENNMPSSASPERSSDLRGRGDVLIQRHRYYDDNLEADVWVEEGIDPKTGAALWHEEFVPDPDEDGERMVLNYHEYPAPEEVLTDVVREAEEQKQKGDIDPEMH